MDPDDSPTRNIQPDEEHRLEEEEENQEEENELPANLSTIDTDSDGEADDEDHGIEPDTNLNMTIGSYEITEKVQATTTYQCHHLLTREMYLCSIINAEQYFNFMAKYERIKIHPGINQVREICTQQDKNLIIYGQTYGNFHEYARNKVRLEENEAVYFFHQMVLIVHDLHNLGIIIRDLKLRRFVFKDEVRRKIVLESWDDSVLLSDPGNDCLSDRYGCPTYASPELVDQSVTWYSGKKADTWSLGIILFAMLTGRYPFYHRVPSQLLHRIERGFYIMPDHISLQASQLVQGLLTKNPDTRFSTSEILNSDWFRLYNRQNVTFSSDFRVQQSGISSNSSSQVFNFPQLLHRPYSHSLHHHQRPSQPNIFNSSSSSASIAHNHQCQPFSDNLTHHHHHHIFNSTLQQRVHSSGTSSRDDDIPGQLISTDQIVPQCHQANPMYEDDDDQLSKKWP